MTYTVHVHYTHLLRTSSYDLWVRLRNLLREQGIDPVGTVVVDLFPDGGDVQFGQIISEDGRVYRFDLFYNRDRPRSVRKATMEHWTDVTDTWQGESLQSQTAEAFIWMIPSRRTDLTARPREQRSAT